MTASGEFGSIEEARELILRARRIQEDLGVAIGLAATSLTSGHAESIAGDEERAERELRRGYELLAKMGEKGYLSTTAAYLAEAVYRLGRYDEADELSRLSEAAAGPTDVSSQIGWRSVRSRLLARRGELEEGERLIREAIDLCGQTDFLWYCADAFLGLADFLALAGRPDETAAPIREALLLYERKGDVVSSARVRRRLEEALSLRR